MILNYIPNFQKLVLKKFNHCSKRPLFKHKSLKREARMEKILYYCKGIYQDAKNSNENTIYFSSHFIPKKWNVEMLSPFAMDDNKLYIYLLVCQYPKFNLLVKPLQMHYSLLWNFFVLNQSQGYWLLSIAFFFALIICIPMILDVHKVQALN